MAVAVLMSYAVWLCMWHKRSNRGIKRTDVQRHDLGVAGLEAIQLRVDFAPGVVLARQSHLGAEVVDVLKETPEYELDGKSPVTLKAGESPSE